MLYQTIPVSLSHHPYPVYVGKGLLDQTSLWEEHIQGRKVMIVTQKNVARPYLKAVLSGLKDYQVDVIEFLAGERYKTLASWQKILNALVKKGHERSTTLIALGGGIVGDVTGFAAACYYRGVSYIQVPTTLMAQVDSAIGGKTGVNLPAGKNLVGAFYQPRCVIVDIATLNTLSEREFTSGLAEIIKSGLIQDERFFSWLEKKITEVRKFAEEPLLGAITRSIQVKAEIVTQDELEQKGTRSLLNFGHTAGHALEALSGYRLRHGEAVALGINIASQLSVALNGLPEISLERIQSLLLRSGLPLVSRQKINIPKFLSYLSQDKKRGASGLRWVLLNEIGKAELRDQVSEEEIIKIISRLSGR